jgi:hypothetical protein
MSVEYTASKLLNKHDILYNVQIHTYWGHDIVSLSSNSNSEYHYNSYQIRVSLGFENKSGRTLMIGYNDYPIDFEEPHTIERFFTVCAKHFDELNKRYINGDFMKVMETE